MMCLFGVEPIPLDKGYALNLLQMNELPAKEFLDANFKN